MIEHGGSLFTRFRPRLLLIEARLPHTARCIGAAALAQGYHLKARIPRSNPFVGLAILTRRDGGGQQW